MPSSGSKAKGRKGKIGKHKASILAYYGNHRYELNKLRRIKAHTKRYGEADKSATVAIQVLKAALPLHLSRNV